jgi:hypothetical protein
MHKELAVQGPIEHPSFRHEEVHTSSEIAVLLRHGLEASTFGSED